MNSTRWIPVTCNTDIGDIFVDADSVTSGNPVTQARLKVNFRRTESGPRSVGSVVSVYEFDCVERRTRVIALEVYEGRDGEGAVRASHSTLGNWVSVPSKEIDGAILDFVCGLSKPR
jgi:hypothetical protein